MVVEILICTETIRHGSQSLSRRSVEGHSGLYRGAPQCATLDRRETRATAKNLRPERRRLIRFWGLIRPFVRSSVAVDTVEGGTARIRKTVIFARFSWVRK